MSAPKVLIVDDEPDVAESLQLLIEAEGGSAAVETRAERAVERVADEGPDLVLCDLRMPKLDGRAVLSALKASPGAPRVVIMSAYGSLDTARQALGWGADDYVSKPLSREDVARLLAGAEEAPAADTDVEAEPAPAEARFGAIVGTSPAMRYVYQMIERIAPFPTTVLIQGDSGVGKELVAQEVHRRSDRAKGPFVPVNCGAIPETLLESELFGYQKGAFTGADRDQLGLIREAHGGTLFLDEIGDLPLMLQVKLLRVIQEGLVQPLGAAKPVRVDVRWITASLRDLEAAVAAGEFRQDLYFRINVMRVELPPLRQRAGDLRLLTAEFLAGLNERYGKGVEGMEADAFELLARHHWPGNIRELENVLERAYILCDGAWITAEAIRGLIGSGPAGPAAAAAGETAPIVPQSLSIKQESARLEDRLIRAALERTGGNRTQAAKLLEISHRALLYKIKDYGIAD